MNPVLANEIIEALGGTTKVAALCEVAPAAVSQWRSNGIPRPWLKYFHAAFPELVCQLQSDGAPRNVGETCDEQ